MKISMSTTIISEQNQLGYFNLITLILSIYVLLMLGLSTVLAFPTEVLRLIEVIDLGICCVFFVEFLVNFYRAPHKWSFLKWGWIDLLASIPMVDALRGARMVRVIRLFRILRAFRSITHFGHYVFRNCVKGAFCFVGLIGILLVICSSIAILQVEIDPNSNIKTAEDALWWAYVTITTVGYGDKYPVTTEGRFIAVLLMTAGVGLFGTLSGLVASWFVQERV